MKILTTNIYLGPSLYAHFPVIRHQVDIGVLEDWPSVRLGKGFIDGLVHALPGLAEHSCSYNEAGGFLRRLREDDGTWMAHIWEHTAIELQNMAGSDVSFGKTRSLETRGLCATARGALPESGPTVHIRAVSDNVSTPLVQTLAILQPTQLLDG